MDGTSSSDLVGQVGSLNDGGQLPTPNTSGSESLVIASTHQVDQQDQPLTISTSLNSSNDRNFSPIVSTPFLTVNTAELPAGSIELDTSTPTFIREALARYEIVAHYTELGVNAVQIIGGLMGAQGVTNPIAAAVGNILVNELIEPTQNQIIADIEAMHRGEFEFPATLNEYLSGRVDSPTDYAEASGSQFSLLPFALSRIRCIKNSRHLFLSASIITTTNQPI